MQCGFSRKSARELLQLVTGPSSRKTQLSLCVQSRAKTNVSGAILRLNKGESPREIDYTNSSSITITVEPDSDSEVKDTPINVEWVDVKLFVDTKDEVVQELKQSGIDFAFVDTLSDATHFYTTQAIPNSADFKNAVVKGIPIVNDYWAKTIIRKPNEVDKWLLKCDYSLYLPNENSAYLPEPKRKLLDTKLISFEPIEWLDTTVVEKSEEDINAHVGTNEFILINSFNVFGFQAVHEADLWNKVMSKMVDSIPTNRVKEPESSQKRPSSAETQSGSRKRRRYEKVDKLHFFSPSATSVPVVESHEGTLKEKQDTKPSIGKLTPKTAPPKPTKVEKAHNSPPPAPEENLASPQPKIEVPENPKKRRNESFTAHKAPKIPKFVPKVSFADAVMQTKEKTKELWEREMGISEEPEGVTQNLSNLAIVEVVDIPIRRSRSKYLNGADNVNTEGKNFKKFVKSVPVKRQVTRPHIDMVIEETTNLLLPKTKHNRQSTMDEDFNGVMSDVRGYEPNLFVADDESDDESTTQPFFTSQTNTSSGDGIRGRRNHVPVNRVDRDDDAGDDDGDDDDDDEEDQPRFGFSR
ncbi:hypothetical protein KGF57_001043 [Candida theae]|uniref:BRCT domain-containing protein n=1 Tax=Candida theae TaxID=1198502 RepID=A0AAD5BIJ6_9ASCO|nr:uncharacterized protein KGF57_001043 [Candida theae]KAI5964551.1 hypothetical protein KGF57_001043 [Candida theae]